MYTYYKKTVQEQNNNRTQINIAYWVTSNYINIIELNIDLTAQWPQLMKKLY